MKLKNEPLSLEYCRKIMNRNGKCYTDEQLLQIRDFMISMIESSIQSFERIKSENGKVIRLTQNIQDENNQTQSLSLRESEHRRTG